MNATPSVIVFDVNETLSDMGPLRGAFADCSLPVHLAKLWFTETLRDGFALSVAGDNPAFADLATDNLKRLINEVKGANYPENIEHIMGALKGLSLHQDAAPGIRALADLADLVTLSNGAASIAEELLERAGVRDLFQRILSVQDAPRWKPAREAYDFAAREVGHPPDELMLVAVHPWDIHGAHAAGLKTAWINRLGGTYPSYFSPADREAPDLVSLARQLTSG
ncbi:haloacid dehalogenase type II [Arthrobacter sp. H5]|uniref:haloacid dehalogenase type II n=1 Tax=Arthrobacter sp. H5 TaxID=1267973 RepID=UPI0004866C06|nr:haloacid dehalogenase type II [Arthrobacter sp. H5]